MSNATLTKIACASAHPHFTSIRDGTAKCGITEKSTPKKCSVKEIHQGLNSENIGEVTQCACSAVHTRVCSAVHMSALAYVQCSIHASSLGHPSRV